MWGPSGHLVTAGSETIHWDGDAVLFTTNSSGAVDDIKFGTHGPLGIEVDITVTNGAASVTYTMRDFSGSVGDPSGPNRQLCSDPAGAPIRYVGPDGISDGLNIFQGVRSYDPSIGTWSSPDAYQGDVGDPMSQKAYMWDGNNSFVYEDPSGYFAQVIVSGNNVTINIPIVYKGTSTHAERAQLSHSIESTWSGQHGQYRVTVHVVSHSIDGQSNTIYTSSKAPPSLSSCTRSCTNAVGGNAAWVQPGADPAYAAAHEAGHLMGLGDKYNRATGTPLPGYETNIMGAYNQYGIKPNQIQQVIKVNAEHDAAE